MTKKMKQKCIKKGGIILEKAKILTKKTLSAEIIKLYEYEFEIDSLNLDKKQTRKLKREIAHYGDSVFVLIFAPDIDSFIFTKEFRAGVFLNDSNDPPFIYGCVAGMIDEHKLPEEIARKEAKEEAGLDIDKLRLIASVYTSPGHVTEKTYIFYTEVEGTPKTGLFGLEHESEEIMTHVVKKSDVYKMMDELKIVDAMTLLALNWFRANEKNNIDLLLLRK